MNDTVCSQATSLESSQRDHASANRARGAGPEVASQEPGKYPKKSSAGPRYWYTSNPNSSAQNQDALGSTASYVQTSHQNYFRPGLSGEGEVPGNASESLEGDQEADSASLARAYPAATDLPAPASRGTLPTPGQRTQ